MTKNRDISDKDDSTYSKSEEEMFNKEIERREQNPVLPKQMTIRTIKPNNKEDRQLLTKIENANVGDYMDCDAFKINLWFPNKEFYVMW